MIKFGLMVSLEAKPGKEEEVAEFLKSALPLVNEESETISWYAIKTGAASFAIFDTFYNEAGRQAHLAGKVAEALLSKADTLLVGEPTIERVDILASK